MPQMMYAQYPSNEIEYLETDLFIYNPKLSKIDFFNNRITTISSNFGIEKISSLNIVDLSGGNKCMSRYFHFSPSDDRPARLKEFLAVTQENCAENVPGFIPDMKKKIDQISSDFQSSTKRLDTEISALGKDLQNVKMDLGRDLQVMKNDLSQDLQDVNKKLIERIEKATAESGRNFTNIYDIFARIANIIELAVDSLKN